MAKFPDSYNQTLSKSKKNQRKIAGLIISILSLRITVWWHSRSFGFILSACGDLTGRFQISELLLKLMGVASVGWLYVEDANSLLCDYEKMECPTLCEKEVDITPERPWNETTRN